MKSWTRHRFFGSCAIAVGSLGLALIFSPVISSSATSPTGSTERDTIGGSTVPAPQCQWAINGSTATPAMANATKYAGTQLTLTAAPVTSSAKVIAVGSDPSATCVWWSATGQNASITASMAPNIYLVDHFNGIYNSVFFPHTTSNYGMYDANGYLSWVFKNPSTDLDMTATTNSDNTASCVYNTLGLSSANASGASLASVGNHNSQAGCSWSTVYSTAIPDQSTLFNGTTSTVPNGTGKALDATFGSYTSVTMIGPVVTTTLSLS